MSASTAAAAALDVAAASFSVSFVHKIVIAFCHVVIVTSVISFAGLAGLTGFASSKAAVPPARHVALEAFRPGTDRDAADDLARSVGYSVRIGVRVVTGSRRPGVV